MGEAEAGEETREEKASGTAYDVKFPRLEFCLPLLVNIRLEKIWFLY